MSFDIALLLAQDGLTNGAIYALLALALVLVFAVTRIIFIPQGDLVVLSALTFAMIQSGQMPGTVWLLVCLALCTGVADLLTSVRSRTPVNWTKLLGWHLLCPSAVLGLMHVVNFQSMGLLLQMMITAAMVVPVGPMIYRLAYQPVAQASTLVLFIISVAVHFVSVGLCLFIFGAEGMRVEPFTDATFEVASVSFTAQSLWIIGVSAVLITGLYLYFDRTINGKALRAAAFSREGARLMGISPTRAGRLSFSLATWIATVSGMLLVPVTTIYYDTGFLISLKGFVGAILGGLSSYPVAAVGAVFVGWVEAGASFWISAFKEVVVFTMVMPVLLWLSLNARHDDEEEEQ